MMETRTNNMSDRKAASAYALLHTTFEQYVKTMNECDTSYNWFTFGS